MMIKLRKKLIAEHLPFLVFFLLFYMYLQRKKPSESEVKISSCVSRKFQSRGSLINLVAWRGLMVAS
jgi:hypothetical protein